VATSPHYDLRPIVAPTKELREGILRVVSAEGTSPSDLLDQLGKQFDESQIKAGLLQLLREGRLALGPDLQLFPKV
jgi:hypothetical protein